MNRHTPSKLMKPVPTTPTVAEDRDKMLDDELVLSPGDPDDYSEGSGNPDDDWDGNNVKTRLTVMLPFRLMIALSLALLVFGCNKNDSWVLLV